MAGATLIQAIEDDPAEGNDQHYPIEGTHEK
jgi:hypothetical protein